MIKNPNNLQLKGTHINNNNSLNKLIRKVKKDYLHKQINASNNKTKVLWSCTNEAC